MSKKNARLSVTRNYMRRVLRELFRTQQEQLAGMDMIIRTQQMFDRSDYGLVKQDFDRLVAKLPNRS